MPTSAIDPEIRELALVKMTNVLGRERAERLLTRVLEDCNLDDLRSADDLMIVSQAMTRLGGFEGAVGAMLGVAAVLRGARPAA